MLRGFFSDDNGQPQGGGADNRPSDVLERHGRDPLRLAEKLAEALEDNYKLRNERRTLKAERADLEKRLAPEGARVLTADEAAAYDAYAKLGKPEEIQGKLTTAQQAAADLANLRRQETIRAAAEAHGYKASALAKLPSLRDQEIALKDVQEGDQTVKRAYVGDLDLNAYITANDPEFLPSLTTATPQPPTGTSYPQQSAGGGKPQSAAQAYINRTYNKGAS